MKWIKSHGWEQLLTGQVRPLRKLDICAEILLVPKSQSCDESGKWNARQKEQCKGFEMPYSFLKKNIKKANVAKVS